MGMGRIDNPDLYSDIWDSFKNAYGSVETQREVFEDWLEKAGTDFETLSMLYTVLDGLSDTMFVYREDSLGEMYGEFSRELLHYIPTLPLSQADRCWFLDNM